MTDEGQVQEEIRCPRCNSPVVHAGRRGFSFFKAMIGGAIAGPLGLAGGAVGNSRIKLTCLRCGYSWRPDQKKHPHYRHPAQPRQHPKSFRSVIATLLILILFFLIIVAEFTVKH